MYAQSQNPFDAFDTLGREARAEADKTRSLLGIGIPQDYIESTVMQQLKANGIEQPEKIIGTLGENTGYAPLNYDMLDSTTKAEIISNNLAQKVNKENLKKVIAENDYMALMNPRLIIEQDLKMEGLMDTNAYNKNRLKQSTIELEIAELKNADWVKEEMNRKKQMDELTIQFKEKQLTAQSTQEALFDFNKQRIALALKLKANPNDKQAKRDLAIVDAQMDQQFLFLARIKEAEKTSIGVPTLTNFYEFQFEQARQSRGYVPALSAPLDPNDATSILVETERAYYPKPDPNNPARL